jgi:hypothetical protein
MRLRRHLSAARRRASLGATIAGAAGLALLGCQNDVNITDPNAPSSQTFFASKADAEAGVAATYNALVRLGTFERWQAFSYDLRSDEGTSNSPWPELQSYVKFQFPSGYNFDASIDTWNDSYTLISRANQVIAAVPNIAGVPDTAKARLVGEAQFLRGLAYFHLITLYGGNIPLITTPVGINDRPASSDSATIWAQIEQDFTNAASGLPISTMAQSGGRASKGAAQGMLGKTLLQERKFDAARAALQPVVNGQMGNYTLVADYGSLFRKEGNNGPESLFEVQMGDTVTINTNRIGGLNIAKMVGPCGPSYCDGLPTRWFFDQFMLEQTTAGRVDPRLEATIFYYRGDTTKVYNKTWAEWAVSDPGRYASRDQLYFKKYGEYYTGSNDQTWEAQINYKVLRFADILLMYAEALNEVSGPGAAKQYVDLVRARAGLAPLPSLDQAGMRAAILHERLLEFGLEGQRWLDLGRTNQLSTQAAVDILKTHDPDFNNFVVGKSVLLPIPQTERNLNPNVNQNPGW